MEATVTREPFLSVSDSWRANPLSRLVWWWLGPLLRLGYKRPLEVEDLGHVHPSESAGLLADRFENMLAAGDHTITQARMIKTLCAFEKWSLLFAACNKLIGDLLGFVGPIALSGIVKFATVKSNGGDDERMGGMEMGYWWLLAATVSAFIQNLCLQHHHQLVIRAAIRVKSMLSLLVFRKSLKIDPARRQALGNGKIQNLQSTDAFAIHFAYFFIHYAWAAPLQIAIAMAMLYAQLGASAFVGLGILLAMIPLQSYLGSLMGHYTKETMQHSDSRIKILNEIIQGIRVIKFFAFEDELMDRVTAAREKEMKNKKSVAIINAINSTFLNAGPLIVALLSFLTYGYVSDVPLSADRAFSALTLFGILRLPLLILPVLTSALTSGRVSAQRLSGFLSEPDLVDYRIFESSTEPAAAVEFQDTVLEWPSSSDNGNAADHQPSADTPKKGPETSSAFALRLQLQLPTGKLTQIVGAVGSGKTALLSSLLGEMALMNGKVIIRAPAAHVGPSMAYCSQQPWIMNATLRDNILFGHRFESDKYAQVIDACALMPDLEMLPAGDQTEIGEKGINLSGGQKARVSLARAVYSDASIVLLDDVLSAVDAHVARQLFSRAIKQLLRNRTVIMVSHQVQFLPQADLVVVMDKGQAVQVGGYSTLMECASTDNVPGSPSSTSNLLAEMMHERHRVDISLSDPMKGSPSEAGPVTDSNDSKDGVVTIGKQASSKLRADEVNITVKPTAGKLIVDEDRNRGRVPLRMYNQYLLQFGIAMLVVMLVSLAAVNVGNVGVDWWLSFWSDNPQLHSVNYYVACYAGITAATTVVTCIQMFSWAYGGVAASLHFHAGMLASIMRSPMRFFDSTPAGRILNRFSGDIEILDKQLPTSFQAFLQLGTRVVSTIIVQAIVFPFTLLATGPILVMYILLQRFYSHSSREIKRIDNITKSPVAAHLAETLTGLPTVRAYGCSARFIATSEARINANTIAYLKYNLINRWLGLRLDWLGSLLICVTCVVAVLQPSVDPGLIGLAISYAMTITNTLNWLVRNSSETETYLSSVERVQHYSSLPSEKPAILMHSRPSPSWPAHGAISINKLTLTYSPELPAVLRDVSVTILPGEKVGVCGRTGAGKSSLMLGLFRILEPSSGSIIIDGIDIATIGLKDLRSRLSIIPQDPVLFEGTLKYNLDPLDTHSEEELMDALASVQLASFVSEQPNGVNMQISGGGESLSVGQRQLICMARSLLRKSKIMVLDEATASTDITSDSIIQRKLRELRGVTQLTIAHRINTIMDSDKILVLEAGRVLEFGSPAALLATQDSAFAKLVRSSAAEADALHQGGSSSSSDE